MKKLVEMSREELKEVYEGNREFRVIVEQHWEEKILPEIAKMMKPVDEACDFIFDYEVRLGKDSSLYYKNPIQFIKGVYQSNEKMPGQLLQHQKELILLEEIMADVECNRSEIYLKRNVERLVRYMRETLNCLCYSSLHSEDEPVDYAMKYVIPTLDRRTEVSEENNKMYLKGAELTFDRFRKMQDNKIELVAMDHDMFGKVFFHYANRDLYNYIRADIKETQWADIMELIDALPNKTFSYEQNTDRLIFKFELIRTIDKAEQFIEDVKCFDTNGWLLKDSPALRSSIKIAKGNLIQLDQEENLYMPNHPAMDERCYCLQQLYQAIETMVKEIWNKLEMATDRSPAAVLKYYRDYFEDNRMPDGAYVYADELENNPVIQMGPYKEPNC